METDVTEAHKERVRGIARQHGISDGIADQVAKETAPNNQLVAIIERIERIEEEKAGLSGDLKEIYAEAKGNGFDTKTIRKIIRLRKMDENQRIEAEALLATYMRACGMAMQTNMDF